MSYANAVYAVLAADEDLTDLVKVFLNREIPVGGINRDDFPQAYFDNGLMRPHIVVKGRGNIPTGNMRDTRAQFTSMQQVVELWMYDDRDAGWDTLEEAADICYGLLHDQQVSGSYQVKLVNEIDEEREPDMGNACMARRDYQVIGFKQPVMEEE